MEASPKKKKKRPVIEIGWREFVDLPDLGIRHFRAKIDTGARTSAIHASQQKLLKQDGADWVEFHVPVPGTPRTTRCRARLVESRAIKNTSGIPEDRYVVETTLVMDGRRWPIEVSLADRENMGFDLILGRTAIRRRRILVNPGKSYLLSARRPRNE